MDFIDLNAQQTRIRDQIDANIKRVLDHGQYILGPEVFELEERLAEYVGVKHCVSMASGTDALLAALMALDIGRGDEVITSAFSFIATGEVIALLGAKPVFVDVCTDSLNLDASQLEAVITSNTKAIVPVSLYGQCADMEAINHIADRHGLPVIEDGAQSFGATYHGRRSCGLSTIGCTSFFPSKPLGGYGDGGACFTDDDGLAQALKEIRVHGQDRRYHHNRVGINGRLDTLQAAILLAKFDIFPQEVEARAQAGERYNRLLSALHSNTNQRPIPPKTLPGHTHVYAQYTIQVDQRDHVQAALKQRGVPTAIHYPIPLPHQPALACEPVSMPVTEAAAQAVLSLPMYPDITESIQEQVAEALGEVLAV